MAKDFTAILAFNTVDKYNRLEQVNQIDLVSDITDKFNGVTLTEHLGGYNMDDGSRAVEYSYMFQIFGLDGLQFKEAEKYFMALGRENKQESILLNGDFIYLNK